MHFPMRHSVRENLSDLWCGRKSLLFVFFVFVGGSILWFALYAWLIFLNASIEDWAIDQLLQGHRKLFIISEMIKACGLVLFMPFGAVMLWRAAGRSASRFWRRFNRLIAIVALFFSCLFWPHFAYGVLWFGIQVGDIPYFEEDQAIWRRERGAETLP